MSIAIETDIVFLISRIFLTLAMLAANRRLIRGTGKYRNARRVASTDVPCARPPPRFRNARGHQSRHSQEQSRYCRRNRAAPKASNFDGYKSISADRVRSEEHTSELQSRGH